MDTVTHKRVKANHQPIQYGQALEFYSEVKRMNNLVLVQTLQNACKQPPKFGHTDTSTLKKDVIGMEKQNLFNWKHYQTDIILLTVRWYLRYNLSFRDLVEMMQERGLSLAHTTIMRWVHQYGPELDKRVRRHLKSTNDSWRVDETYVKGKGQWMYLYRTVDSKGNTIDFHLSKTRDHRAAKRFFKKALQSFHVSKPRVITVDKNPAYPIAIEELKKEKKMPVGIQIRQVKYLNNIVEQDHHFIKKRVRSMLGLNSFHTAKSILSGIEAMHIIKKRHPSL